jgi:enamine deaminase RidA (YjgF/YER057c/UK114 family)
VERRTISSGAIWESVVGYSRAVQAGNLIFVAGTTAATPGGEPVGGDDAAEQAREAIRRIEAALTELGADLRSVVQTRIFVTDIGNWEAVGRAHGESFGEIRPVSSMYEVSGLIAPDLLVEIEAVAVVDRPG